MNSALNPIFGIVLFNKIKIILDWIWLQNEFVSANSTGNSSKIDVHIVLAVARRYFILEIDSDIDLLTQPHASITPEMTHEIGFPRAENARLIDERLDGIFSGQK